MPLAVVMRTWVSVSESVLDPDTGVVRDPENRTPDAIQVLLESNVIVICPVIVSTAPTVPV